MVPFANLYFMSIATLGIWIGSWFADWHLWSEVPRLWNAILAVLMLLIVLLERPRGWNDLDESAMSPDDAPMIPDDLSNLTSTLSPDIAWPIGLKMATLQSMLLAVKGMAGYTLWAVILMMVVLLFLIPWKKRQLRPEEIPDEM